MVILYILATRMVHLLVNILAARICFLVFDIFDAFLDYSWKPGLRHNDPNFFLKLFFLDYSWKPGLKHNDPNSFFKFVFSGLSWKPGLRHNDPNTFFSFNIYLLMFKWKPVGSQCIETLVVAYVLCNKIC